MPRLVEIRKELSAARACTDHIFSLFHPETLYERPIPERHRLVFYVGHLEAFDWNQICRWTLGQSSFHDTFDSLFEAGIDPEVGSEQTDVPSDWPSLQEIRRYNIKSRESVDRALEDAPETVLRMAIEHRWMHAETTAYLLHHVTHGGKIAPSLSTAPDSPSPNHVMVDVPQGVATLGRSDGFGWDNEFNEHREDVPAFAISKYKVTNQQYQAFVEQGGPFPRFGSSGASAGSCRRCSKTFRFPRIGPSTYPSETRGPMRNGPGSHCRPKHNIIARRMGH